MDSVLDFLENSGDAVCAINSHQHIVYWNDAAEEIFGFTTDEAIGKPCWVLLQGETAEGHAFCQKNCPIVHRQEEGKATSHFDLRFQSKSGAKLLTSISTLAQPIPDAEADEEQIALVHLMRVTQDKAIPLRRLRIYMLGPLLVYLPDGSQVLGTNWRRAKVRALLAYLALKQGQPVPRRELLEALWPEMERGTGLHNLNTTVYNLRRCLEPSLTPGVDSQYIVYQSGHYWLSGDGPHWLDVDLFKRNIKQARLETAVNRAIFLYQEAVQLYRGDYLMDVLPVGAGSHIEQNRLHQMYLTALEELGNLHEQQAEPEKARDAYMQILALDSRRENVSQQLAKLSRREDDRIDNLSYCHRLATALKDELDMILSHEIFVRHDPQN